MAVERRYCPLCEEWMNELQCAVHGVPTIAASNFGKKERELAEGTVIGGRYTIQRVLGEGGMGTVYLAFQSSMSRKIALKTLSFRLRDDARLVKRFYREARASSALVHPNIVQVYDFGVDDNTSIPYIAMEYLEGTPLDEMVQKEKALPESRAAFYVAEVARALTEAHRKGVIHRDLKPDNVMIRQLSDGAEQVTVLDFGIAKIMDDDGESLESLTAANVAMGTPAFMSPEQARSLPLDARADLYSLGCLLHHLLTGRPPFEAKDLVGVLMKHLEAPAPKLPKRLRDGRPPSPEMRALYQRLMSKAPDDRPSSTQEVADALSNLTGRPPAISQNLGPSGHGDTLGAPIRQHSSGFSQSPQNTQLQVLMAMDSEENLEQNFVRYQGELGLLRHHLFGDEPEIRGALVGAIRRAKTLHHPRLQPVHGVNAESYVLPVVPGEALGALINAARIGGREPIPPNAIAHLAYQLAEGLAVLHDAGQCYGEIDTERIHVTLEGDVSLMDRPGMTVLQFQAGTGPATTLDDVRSWAKLIEQLTGNLEGHDTGELLQKLAQSCHSGEFVDAISLLETFQRNASGASEFRAWLEDTFAQRWAEWRRHWGQIKAEEAIAGLLWDAVEADPKQTITRSDSDPLIEMGEQAQTGSSPKKRRRKGQKTTMLALPKNGFEPRLFDDREDDEDYVAPRLSHDSVDQILRPLSDTEATGDPNSALVLEVVRVRKDTAMASTFLHVGKTYRYRDQKLARMGDRGANIFVPEGATAHRYRLGEKSELTNGQRLELGERAAVELDGRIFRFRVDRAAREVGKATGIKKPYRLWFTCGALGLGLHVGFFLFVMSLSSLGIQLTVEKPADEERFAHLKPPSELPKDKPKPKKKKKKPKKTKKKKPKPQVRKTKPKPPDPTEAPPVIPDRLRDKLQSRIKKRTSGAKSATEALLKQLAAPDPTDAPSVSDIRANIDAVRGSGRSGAFQVAGDLVAGVPGAKIQVAGASGGVVTKGKSGKGVGKLGKRARGGRSIRGKVKASKVMAKVRGSLSKAEVSKAINSRIGRIQRCYEKELMKSNKTLSGKIKAEWTVTTSGKVRAAKVKLNTLGNQKVASCVLKEIKKIRFPKPKGGEVVIVYPFIFSSR